MTLKESLNPRVNNITLLRLILSSLVIVGHTYAINPSEPKVILDVSYVAPFLSTGSFAVKVFFFLSGLLIVNSLNIRQSSVHYWSHRLMRIFPGLLFVLVLSSLLIGPFFTQSSLYDYFHDRATYRYIYKNVILIPRYNLPGVFLHNPHPNAVNGSLWSLTWEFKCYIATYLIYILSFKKYFRWIGTICFLILILQVLFFNHFGLGELTWYPYYPLYYFFGGILALHAERIKLNYKLMGYLFLLMVSGYFLPLPFDSLFFMIFWCVFLLWFVTTKFAMNLELKHDVSYGVYLWGFVVQQSLHSLFPNWGSYLHMTVALIISIAMGIISWFLVEKPCMSLAKRISNLSLSKAIPF